jgi:hypothetical protein
MKRRAKQRQPRRFLVQISYQARSGLLALRRETIRATSTRRAKLLAYERLAIAEPGARIINCTTSVLSLSSVVQRSLAC